ncbi:MAG: hypothetical protein QOF29_817, partial [bacterium]
AYRASLAADAEPVKGPALAGTAG